MAISPNDLIALFKQALDDNWGYIYGTAGIKWTQAKQDAATREQTIKWGKKWIGHMVADCSGLFTWAFKQLGGTMYHGSNTMFKTWSTASGTLKSGLRSDGQVLKPGSAVYKWSAATGYHHVGLYIGAGAVIEAKGTYYGVIKSSVSEWHSWSELKGVDYDASTDQQPEPVQTLDGECSITSANGKSVNVRTAPSTSALKRCTLPVGSAVNVIEDDGTWSKVEYVQTGYVMTKFIKRG